MLNERDLAVRRRFRDVREGSRLEEAGPMDIGDRSQSDLIREIDISLLENEADDRANIGDALRRVERGDEGACAQCGGSIGRARLQAVPFTDVCKTCKEKEEYAGPGAA